MNIQTLVRVNIFLFFLLVDRMWATQSSVGDKIDSIKESLEINGSLKSSCCVKGSTLTLPDHTDVEINISTEGIWVDSLKEDSFFKTISSIHLPDGYSEEKIFGITTRSYSDNPLSADDFLLKYEKIRFCGHFGQGGCLVFKKGSFFIYGQPLLQKINFFLPPESVIEVILFEMRTRECTLRYKAYGGASVSMNFSEYFKTLDNKNDKKQRCSIEWNFKKE